MPFDRTSWQDEIGRWATRPLSQMDAKMEFHREDTHASDDLEKFLRVGLWEAPYGVHFVDVERNGTSTELLDE